MDDRDDGGPAFPTLVDNGASWDEPGMTLRDYFAAAALQGMLGRPSSVFLADLDKTIWASRAYDWADAMLKARKS